ncbi:hypothetical protein MMC07_004212 [Pseudocyphellaria aurata]|nr:hypothetical protein [Pseudocyphellaria aurata]
MMEYFTFRKAKPHPDHREKSEALVLSEEDEAFLHRIASEGTPPPLPERPQDLSVAGESSANNAQIALMNGAQNIPLPDVPDTPDGIMASAEDQEDGKGQEKQTVKHSKSPFKWSFLRRDSRDGKRKEQNVVATDLLSVAEGIKPPDAHINEDGNVSNHEAKKEEEEMTAVLDQLNLAAVNNRVFSISKESQDLLRKYVPNFFQCELPHGRLTRAIRFTLVLKDLVNGVPTAYDDLESLLTNSENQLQRSYKNLPSFLQKLIEQLPSKMTQSIGPEMLAAAAEKQGLHSKYTDQAAQAAGKMGLKVKVPSLKDLVAKPGAVAGMLRAIMNFLKLRFPAFLGMNVLYSLALFVLLFVFWYCHKRGREVRLEKERLLTEAEVDAVNRADPTSSTSTSDPPTTESSPPLTTTAPAGATIEEVQAGMHHHPDGDDDGQEQESAPYADGGSLAKELKREREEAAAAKAKAAEGEN